MSSAPLSPSPSCLCGAPEGEGGARSNTRSTYCLHAFPLPFPHRTSPRPPFERSAEVQCPKPFIQTRRGISRECFLPPGPTGRIQMISRVRSAGLCGEGVGKCGHAVLRQGKCEPGPTGRIQMIPRVSSADLSWAGVGQFEHTEFRRRDCTVTTWSNGRGADDFEGKTRWLLWVTFEKVWTHGVLRQGQCEPGPRGRIQMISGVRSADLYWAGVGLCGCSNCGRT